MKKLISIIFKKKIILVLLLAILILASLSFFFNKNPREKTIPSTSPSPSPFQEHFKVEEKKETPIKTEVIQEEIKLTKERYPLIDWLPLDTENYHLTYSAPHTLQIALKKGNKETAKEQIIEWIKSKGIDPESQKIIFK